MRGTALRATGVGSPPRFRCTDKTMKALLSPLVGRMLVLARSLGPYAAIELLLPGGSVLALLYWWYRRRIGRERAPRGKRPMSGASQEQSFVRALRRLSIRAEARAAEKRSRARGQPCAATRSRCHAAAA